MFVNDDSDTCRGSGLYVNDVRVSKPSWHKVMYVTVHLGYLDVSFEFRPFESHFEIHSSTCYQLLEKVFYRIHL